MTLRGEINLFWSPTSLLIRSHVIRNRKPFYNEARLHADVEACYEVLRNSDFGFVHQVLTFIRRHDDSVTSSVVAPFNRFILTNLDLLTRYGPVYLRAEEYNKCLRAKLNEYYHFLARSLFNLRECDFWKYHKKTIEEIGHPFSIPRLTRACVLQLIDRPRATVGLLAKAIARKL